MVKTASTTSVALIPFSVFNLAGQPGAGTLAGTSTAAGVVPTDATAGCPIINFTVGTGYLSKIEYGNTVVARTNVYDMLWKGGAYTFSSNVTLAAQPAISGRCPDWPGSGIIFGNGNEIWLETVTAFTGLQTIAVTYTNSAGTTGRTTGSLATGAAPIVGRMLQLPLQAGDSGVQKIETVISTVATVGTFNVLILRPLTTDLRVRLANEGGVYDVLSTGMPIVYPTSAFIMTIQADAVSTGLPHVVLELASA